MKIYTKLLSLIFLCSCLSGCIVQSWNPFFTKDTLIEMPQLNGEWILLEYMGSDVSDDNMKPWIFREGEIQTYSEDGYGGLLDVHYFKVKENTFIDFIAGNFPEDANISELWTSNIVPVHTICKISIKDDLLILKPMNAEWFGEAIEAKKILLPYMLVEVQEDRKLITAKSEEWIAFLEKYGDDEEVFTEEYQFVLKMKKNEKPAGE